MEDGRTKRRLRNRDLLLMACRELMAAGKLRPTANEVADRAALSERTLVAHFGRMDALYREALNDRETQRLIARRVAQQQRKRAAAAVRGRTGKKL